MCGNEALHLNFEHEAKNGKKDQRACFYSSFPTPRFT